MEQDPTCAPRYTNIPGATVNWIPHRYYSDRLGAWVSTELPVIDEWAVLPKSVAERIIFPLVAPEAGDDPMSSSSKITVTCNLCPSELCTLDDEFQCFDCGLTTCCQCTTRNADEASHFHCRRCMVQDKPLKKCYGINYGTNDHILERCVNWISATKDSELCAECIANLYEIQQREEREKKAQEKPQYSCDNCGCQLSVGRIKAGDIWCDHCLTLDRIENENAAQAKKMNDEARLCTGCHKLTQPDEAMIDNLSGDLWCFRCGYSGGNLKQCETCTNWLSNKVRKTRRSCDDCIEKQQSAAKCAKIINQEAATDPPENPLHYIGCVCGECWDWRRNGRHY